MTIRTPLCDMLGIQYPIMLAGMGGVSYAELAAAVSNAGGFGTLGMAGRSHEEIKVEIKKVGEVLVKMAVTQTRLDNVEQDIRDLKHGRGFIQGNANGEYP